MITLAAIMAVSIISYYGFGDESKYMDYTYATITNASDIAFSSGENATATIYGLNFGRLISGQTDGTNIAITITNDAISNSTITAYLNGNSLGSGIAVLSDSTELTFNSIQDYLNDGTNTIIVSSSGDDVTLNNTAIYYNYDVYDSSNSSVVSIAIFIVVVTLLIGVATRFVSRYR